jgi:hypothetical protein
LILDYGTISERDLDFTSNLKCQTEEKGSEQGVLNAADRWERKVQMEIVRKEKSREF